jgi:hypothetical protein
LDIFDVAFASQAAEASGQKTNPAGTAAALETSAAASSQEGTP